MKGFRVLGEQLFTLGLTDRYRLGNRVTAGGDEFSPSDISGLQLWLKADTGTYQDTAGTTPATNDGHAVQLWQDQSGNGYHVQQSTAGKIPVLKLTTNGINNRAAISFDGGDLLRNATANWLSSNSAGTLAVVYKLASVAAGVILATADEAGLNNWIQIMSALDGTNKNVAIVQTNADPVDNVRGSTTIGTSTVMAVYRSSGAAYTMRVNGADETLTVVGGANNGDWFADITGRDNFVIGALKRSTEANFINGLISEVLVYDTNLTGADLTNLEAYLDERYFP